MIPAKKLTRGLCGAALFLGGGILFSNCQVTLPGLYVDASEDGAFVDFPGGIVEVRPQTVLIEVPGVRLDVHPHELRVCYD